MTDHTNHMSTEELVSRTENLGKAVTSIVPMLDSVGKHLQLLAAVVNRLYTENQQLQGRIDDMTKPITIETVAKETISGWPTDLCVVGSLIVKLIEEGVKQNKLRYATCGNLESLAGVLTTDVTPLWHVTNMPVKTNTVGRFDYGYVPQDKGGPLYLFGLCTTDMVSDDMSFEVALGYRLLDITVVVKNSVGHVASKELTPDAFADLLDRVVKGTHASIIMGIYNSFDTPIIPELVLPTSPELEVELDNELAKDAATQHEPVQEQIPAPVEVEHAHSAPTSPDNGIINVINTLLAEHQTVHGSIKTYQDSIVNTNPNEPRYWSRDALIYFNTGVFARGDGQVLIRKQRNSEEDLVILWHIKDGNNVFGYYRVIAAQGLCKDVGIQEMIDILKEIEQSKA